MGAGWRRSRLGAMPRPVSKNTILFAFSLSAASRDAVLFFVCRDRPLALSPQPLAGNAWHGIGHDQRYSLKANG